MYERPDGSGAASFLTCMLYLSTGGGDNFVRLLLKALTRALHRRKAALVATASCLSLAHWRFLSQGGGETRFVSDPRSGADPVLVPRLGDVLVFTHPVLHEGCAVTCGRKYCVRTDVMYVDG